MKKIVSIIAIAIFALGTALNCEAAPKKKTEQVTFNVNLHCADCVKKVEANLPFAKGIVDMKVSLDDQTVWIEYNPSKTDKESLKKAIEKIGYSVGGEACGEKDCCEKDCCDDHEHQK
ncbi:MAG: heavy-metal-associated domain-containing protein [Bacteroidales bacterium]|nr:heavy-metal-associated domain-containing protein [Bacteroidales bacterium]